MHRFRRRRDRGQAAEQRTEAAGFAERLAAADARRAEPDSAPLAAPSGVPTIAQRSDVDAVRDELTDRIDQLAERIATLDARITSISTEPGGCCHTRASSVSMAASSSVSLTGRTRTCARVLARSSAAVASASAACAGCPMAQI